MLALFPIASAPIAAAGRVVTFASLAATEAEDTASVSASITASVALAVTEQQDTVAVTTEIVASAALSVTDQQDTATITTSAVTLASLAVTEAQDIVAFVSEIDPAILFLLAADQQDTASISTAIVASLALAATEAQDTTSTVVYVLWSIIPETAQSWTTQSPQIIFWQDIDPALPASNSGTIGPIASAPIVAIPIAALAAGGPTGITSPAWTVISNDEADWDAVAPTAAPPWVTVQQTYNPSLQEAA